jgi:ParD-like antitoxin of type II bacterial toxin-antitoxin system
MSIPIPASTTLTINSTATPAPVGFSSVKLPAALVQQARDAAQPLRRSVAGQIEYWATLGRVVEHTGLTAQEARTAIEGYEAAARETFLANALDDLEARFAAAEASGSLADRVREVVLANRAKAVDTRLAA